MEILPLEICWWWLAILEALSLAKETVFIVPATEKGGYYLSSRKRWSWNPRHAVLSHRCEPHKATQWEGVFFWYKAFLNTPCNHAILLFLRHFCHGFPTAVYLVYICLHRSAGIKLINGLKSQQLSHEQDKSINSLNISFYLSFLYSWLCDLTPKHFSFDV